MEATYIIRNQASGKDINDLTKSNSCRVAVDQSVDALSKSEGFVIFLKDMKHPSDFYLAFKSDSNGFDYPQHSALRRGLNCIGSDCLDNEGRAVSTRGVKPANHQTVNTYRSALAGTNVVRVSSAASSCTRSSGTGVTAASLRPPACTRQSVPVRNRYGSPLGIINT